MLKATINNKYRFTLFIRQKVVNNCNPTCILLTECKVTKKKADKQAN